jgi:drug/metabolite transporter (DMT)-like permease
LAVVFGLLVAVSFGSADFLGGRASRAAATPAVLLVAQATAVAGAIVVALAVGADVTTPDLVFGALAGGVNVIGLGLLYRGLTTGRMGVVAPVTAVVGACVPVTWGIASGERPSGLVGAGVLLAIVAGGLIAREHDSAKQNAGIDRAIAYAIAAGFALGTSFVFFAKTSDASGFWPVLTARAAAVVVVGIALVALRTRGPVAFPQGTDRTLALAAGALDVAATALLLLAVRRGLAVVVAPVASLAPAATVVLAWLVLGERAGGLQRVGLVVAIAGLVLIAAG